MFARRNHVTITDPEHRGQAMSSKYKDEWIQAEKEELSALRNNNTWKVVERPANAKPISCRWVYKVKLNPDNSVKKFKARLVAKGFQQREGIDYNETFAAVALMKSFRVLLAVALSRN